MTRTMAQTLVMVATFTASVSAADPHVVAHYTFDEARGVVVSDRSGNGHDGRVHNAAWVRPDRGGGLDFQKASSFVDCGPEPGRKLASDMTLLAWVRLAADPYPDGTTNWTILDCEDYTHSGFVVRIDGQTGKLYYRASHSGQTTDGFSRASIENGEFHLLAVTRQGNRVTLAIDGRPEASFLGDPPAPPTRSLSISNPGQPFQGVIAELVLLDRGLSGNEILERYKAEARRRGKDTSWFGTFHLEPSVYLDRREITAEVDFLGVLPFPPGTRAVVELGMPGKPPATTIAVPATLAVEAAQRDFRFDLTGLAPGDYELRVALRDQQGRTITQKTERIQFPPPPVQVPRPADRVLPPLPPEPRLQQPCIQVDENGGFAILVGGDVIPVASGFSYPGGGFDVLGSADVAGSEGRNEGAWKPETRRLGATTYVTTASGRYHAVSRRLEIQPSRLLIQDTITNRTAEPLGVLVRHRVLPPARTWTHRYLAGYRAGGDVTARVLQTNPTIFLSSAARGLGIVALDDVFIVQSLATVHAGTATLHTDTFALEGHASYSLEWALYPTSSSDYYEFINQFRRDEGRNGTIDGGVGFITHGPSDRRGVPDREFVELRNLKYGLIHCLSFAADDPGVSIEGIEFRDFPRECQRLREQLAAIHRAFPEMKVAFHVAHSLYATRKPQEVFPDSRVIDASGKHAVYTDNPGSYFSKQRRDEGWNWYIYYPTLDNSFGKALLESVDTIMGEIGADGVFMDGFMWAYGGPYTFDRWDSHTAQIDPSTKTITRKMGSVLLLSQDALVAFCRKIHARGGVVIANNSVITRTIARERYILHDRECFAGPELHVASTPMTLSLPAALGSEANVHRDVLDKLRWGSLYVYYQEGKLTHPSVPSRMYPFTFQELHSGYVRGEERLVTMNSGLYGWAGVDQLHQVSLFDRRGVSIPHAFFTTAETIGVRTRLDLTRDQCAVIARIPLTLRSTSPVNLHVSQYDRQAIDLVASASDSSMLTVRGGDFRVEANTEYMVTVGTHQERIRSDGTRTFSVSLPPGERVAVRIEPARDR